MSADQTNRCSSSPSPRRSCEDFCYSPFSIDGFSSSPSAVHLFPAPLSSYQVISRHSEFTAVYAGRCSLLCGRRIVLFVYSGSGMRLCPSIHGRTDQSVHLGCTRKSQIDVQARKMKEIKISLSKSNFIPDA